MKKNIAVFIHGQLRFWDISSKILSLWNNISDNYYFDFYLATWKDENSKDIEKNLKLQNFSLHTTDEMYSKMAAPLTFYYKNIIQARTIPSYQHYYSFLLHKAVNNLKNSAIRESCYDAAILMRPDIFIRREIFEFLDKKFNFEIEDEHNNTVPFGRKIIYSKSGSEYCQDSLFCGSDTLFLGSLKGIQAFADIYDDVFVKQLFPTYHLHKLQAEYLCWKRLYNKSNNEMNHHLIRSKDNVKPGWPTPEGLNEILNTLGKDLYLPENKNKVTSILDKHSGR